MPAGLCPDQLGELISSPIPPSCNEAAYFSGAGRGGKGEGREMDGDDRGREGIDRWWEGSVSGGTVAVPKLLWNFWLTFMIVILS